MIDFIAAAMGLGAFLCLVVWCLLELAEVLMGNEDYDYQDEDF